MLNKNEKLPIINNVFLLFVGFGVFSCSGCFLLVAPVAGIMGNSIHEHNAESDNIIVNLSYKYNLYKKEKEKENSLKTAKGESPDEIEDYNVWLAKQGDNEKEKKAIARYFRLKKGS